MGKEPVYSVKLEGNCIHALSYVECEDCRRAELRKVKRKAARPEFAEFMGDELDLDELVTGGIRYVAARAIQDQVDNGFYLSEVVEELFTARKLTQFTRAMFGTTNAHFQEMAKKHVLDRIRAKIRIRDPQTNTRVYVCWRVPGQKPRKWGALDYLGVTQLQLVARDYGILGEGVAFSKDATRFLIDLMEQHGPTTLVNQVWDEAVPQLVAWREGVA